MWQRVAVQEPTEVRTAAGAVTYTWADMAGLESVPARVLPSVREQPGPEMTVVEDAYEVHLAGAYPEVRPEMRVLDGAVAYDVRRVVPPPPFGTPVTVLEAVRVAPEVAS